MKQEDLDILNEALQEASCLISNEIECVIYDDLYSEYDNVLDKIDCALRIVEKYRPIQ